MIGADGKSVSWKPMLSVRLDKDEANLHNKFESHWVPHSCGLVTHPRKKTLVKY